MRQNGATFNTIMNCLVRGNTTTSTYACIVSSGTASTQASAAAANSNNTYQNNGIHTGLYGIILDGLTVNLDQNNLITGNTIGSSVAASKLAYSGIYVDDQNTP